MALELEVDPLPENSPNWDVALYPNGGKITDLKETRDLLYKLQRPGISPHVGRPIFPLSIWPLNQLFLIARLPTPMVNAVGLRCCSVSSLIEYHIQARERSDDLSQPRSYAFRRWCVQRRPSPLISPMQSG
jgi:hypothetical protein